MPERFVPFSGEHLAAVLVGVVAIAALILAGRRGGRPQTLATAVLAFLNLTAYPFSQLAWRSVEMKTTLDNLLPLHLCDIAAVTAGFALLTRHPLLCLLTYFWGLAATFQGLLTPAVTVGFPHWPFVMFFVHHFAVVAAALYLPLVLGWRPRPPFWKGPLEAYLWALGYLALALAANGLLGTNFGFASGPPPNASLIDHLGPWPWYLVSMQVIGLALFLLLALPFARCRPGGK
jgi:hypothetical integral membrane protein (TIGR02206 family)